MWRNIEFIIKYTWSQYNDSLLSMTQSYKEEKVFQSYVDAALIKVLFIRWKLSLSFIVSTKHTFLGEGARVNQENPGRLLIRRKTKQKRSRQVLMKEIQQRCTGVLLFSTNSLIPFAFPITFHYYHTPPPPLLSTPRPKTKDQRRRSVFLLAKGLTFGGAGSGITEICVNVRTIRRQRRERERGWMDGWKWITVLSSPASAHLLCCCLAAAATLGQE